MAGRGETLLDTSTMAWYSPQGKRVCVCVVNYTVKLHEARMGHGSCWVFLYGQVSDLPQSQASLEEEEEREGRARRKRQMENPQWAHTLRRGGIATGARTTNTCPTLSRVSYCKDGMSSWQYLPKECQCLSDPSRRLHRVGLDWSSAHEATYRHSWEAGNLPR